MIAWLLARQIIGLFLMMAAGGAIVRLRAAKSEDARVLSVMSVYIAAPSAIFMAFQIEMTPTVMAGMKLALIGALLSHAVLFAVAYALARPFKLNGIEKASAIYSNAGNLIIPLVSAVLGAEYVIYTSVYICMQNITMWTHASSLVRGEREIRIVRALRSPNIIAVIIGASMFFAGVRVPAIISGSLAAMGSTLGPISMIMLGMIFARVSMKKVFLNARVYLVTAMKMIIAPAVVLVILKFSPLKTIAPNGETILLITLLATIGPTATTITNQAQLFGRDAELAASINIMTTIVCIFSMPSIVMIYM